MSDILTQPTLQNEDEEVDSRQLFIEMQCLNDLMRQDQVDIDRLKIETNVLKAETLRLKTESRALLVKLGAVI